MRGGCWHAQKNKSGFSFFCFFSSPLSPLEETGCEVTHVLWGVEDLVETILGILPRETLVGAHNFFELSLRIGVTRVLVCCASGARVGEEGDG